MTAQKLYVRRMLTAAVLYTVTLLVAIGFTNNMEPSLTKVLLLLIPVLPTVYGAWAWITLLGSLDEMLRRIHFEAFGFSIAMTGLITFTLAFIEKAGYPTLDLFWVLPMLIAFWGIGLVFAQRKYA